MIYSDKTKPSKLEGCVVAFANHALKKLNKKKNQGRTGWDDEGWMQDYDRLMSRWEMAARDHFLRALENDSPDDMVDVSNFMLFRYVYLIDRDGHTEERG